MSSGNVLAAIGILLAAITFAAFLSAFDPEFNQ